MFFFISATRQERNTQNEYEKCHHVHLQLGISVTCLYQNIKIQTKEICNAQEIDLQKLKEKEKKWKENVLFHVAH